ncbi:hypothetical protein D3C87_988350 [compost metagenome]
MPQAGERPKGAEYHSSADVAHNPFSCGNAPPPKKQRVDPALRLVAALAVFVLVAAVLRTAWNVLRHYV